MNHTNGEVSRRVLELINELTANDTKIAHEYFEDYLVPEEPEKAMKALVKMGESAVKPLVELLKNTSRFSCLYAIKVLGKLRDPAAVEPLVDLLDNQEFNEEFEEGFQDIVDSLQKIGLPALQPVLSYLEEQDKRGNSEGIIFALQILSKIKDERSYSALTKALSIPDDEVQGFALEYLVDYGDKRAAEHLAKLLEDPEWKEDLDDVKSCIRLLTKPNKYREILREHGLVGAKRIDSFKREMDIWTRRMMSAYEFEKEFKGYQADQLNAIAREARVRESLGRIFQEISELTVDEAIVPYRTYERLEGAIKELWHRHYAFERKHQEELGLIFWNYIPNEFRHENVKKEEKRSYKGLALEIERLSNNLIDWFTKRNFRITLRGRTIIARKGRTKSRQGCFLQLDVWGTGGRGRWGRIDLSLWGKGWTDEKTTAFTSSFWQIVDETIIKLNRSRSRIDAQDLRFFCLKYMPLHSDTVFIGER